MRVWTSGSRLWIYYGPPLLATLLLWLTSSNPLPWSSAFCALLLAAFPWWSYLGWRNRKDEAVPLVAVIGAIYWLYFGFALFWGEYSIRMWKILEVGLSADAVDSAMRLATLGVVCLWLGAKSGLGAWLAPRRVVDVSRQPFGRQYVRIVLLTGLMLSLFEGFTVAAGGGLRQLLSILQQTVPLTAFAILFRDYLGGRADNRDKLLIVAFLVVKTVVGAASGWVGSMAILAVVCGVVYIEERRKLPLLPVALTFLMFLFFQAGKNEFRAEFWERQTEAGRIDRIRFWVDESIEAWVRDLANPDGAAVKRRISQTFSRTSLLPQTANVLEWTPEVVPHQGGHLYSYMLVTLVPRLVWPDKPSVNEANRFYQVAYGLTTEENLENVSIAVGTLTEAYIAYGWWGTVFVMFAIGVALGYLQRVFFSADSGTLFRGLGAALMFQLIGIEAQMAQYFGGLVQQVAVTTAVMLPVLRIRERQPPTTKTAIRHPRWQAPLQRVES